VLAALTIVSISSVLSEIMLILKELRSFFNLWIDELGSISHLSNFFKNNSTLNSLLAVLSPRERTVVLAKASRNSIRVDAKSLEFINDELTGIKLVGFLYFLCSKAAKARDVA
jgi:hypothetical protein